jgi:hypothetical protein
MKISLWFFIILFIITIGMGIAHFIIDMDRDNKKDIRISQLEDINKLLNQRYVEVTSTTIPDKTIVLEKPFDQEVLEFVIEYNTAQRTYIELLTGLLRNNHIDFPEFAYEKLLKENIE